MHALLHKIPLLQANVEDLTVQGDGVEIPRFHLVPLEIPTSLPSMPSLVLRYGLVYMPPVFYVCMRRFDHLTRLVLQLTTFLSVHDLRRMLDSLRNMKILALSGTRWLPSKREHLPCTCLRPLRSRVRLEQLEVDVEAEWVTDTRSIEFLDWLSTSGAISEVHCLRLAGLTLINKALVAAASKILDAVQKPSKLRVVDLLFGPDIDLSPCEFLSSLAVFTAHAQWRQYTLLSPLFPKSII